MHAHASSRGVDGANEQGMGGGHCEGFGGAQPPHAARSDRSRPLRPSSPMELELEGNESSSARFAYWFVTQA